MKEIKLNMNEIPFQPQDNVVQSAKKGIPFLNRYSSPKDLFKLLKHLADYTGVPKRHIIVGPGSDLLLRDIVLSTQGRKVIMVFPTFFPTYSTVKQFSTNLITVPLEPPQFELDPYLILKELNEPSLIIIDNPNNPTGILLLRKNMVKEFLENNNALIVLDEAYFEFSGSSYAHMVEDYPNLGVVRSFSKAFGLAGARIGYIVAGKSFLDLFSTYDIFLPQSSILAVTEALKDSRYMKENIKRTILERTRVEKELSLMGITVYPSVTNFMLIHTKIPELGKKLENRGILVFDLSNRWRSGFIRVSLGLPEENDILIAILNELMEK
ncbi:MAG: pyridoxal phosphate-dependent aminotransferase [Candidatus Hodarchaeales archaeon]|jgi:histidinol-phosphate aminotransferase